MERACRLSNATYWEITPSLPLPSLPVSCGARSQRLLLSEETIGGGTRSVDRKEVLENASRIADLLRDCDVSYLNVKEEQEATFIDFAECPRLYSEVLRYNSGAFEYSVPGFSDSIKEKIYNDSVPGKKPFEQNGFSVVQTQKAYGETVNNQFGRNLVNDPATDAGSRKPKIKKKELESISLSTTEVPDYQEIIRGFCETVDDFCGRAEISSCGQDMGTEGASLPLTDIKIMLNEINAIREKKLLHLIRVDTFTRLLNVLDHQIKCGQGLSVDEAENADVDAVSLVFCALESTYAALAIMTHHGMPKQLYKDEMIERILDFSRHQIMEVMAAFDPSYRAIHKPNESVALDGDDDEEDEAADLGSAGKKRRNTRIAKVKKASGNKVSAAVSTVLQKLCSILGFLKDLLTVERLSDSCILQLIRTSFSTFLVDNIQILQLKAISLICTVFGSYTQHRNFIIDETLQLLRKLPCSKRAIRTYLLPDEEQKQIQMITALLIHLVQYCADLPETVKSKITYNSLHDISINVNFPTKCYEAATEACCLFWTNVLQRLTTAKAQDISESKMILENLVMDLLTTLNLPEYPASASILEVLCVLLLQNAGLKSKDISARCMAVDLLGTVAARLKHDAVVCSRDKFWIVQELFDESNDNTNEAKDICHVCLEGRGAKTVIVCHFCQRCFHVECLGFTGRELLRDWSCHICLCKKQLTVLQSSFKSNCKNDDLGGASLTDSSYGTPYPISSLEVVQQVLLNYLQENSLTDDIHLYTRWFYLCLWYKDDPHCQDKILYYLSRLKSKAILRDFGSSSFLSRKWAKKLSLALGQKNSFSRGFDKILSLLLASLRENSPVLRAKALRAVSAIVEADPEVLCDKRVQSAVEGRFCDSAISVREAALELVGRHIATHPDVALKYFDKVAERIKDTGVSVRKRAMKIIRDMCISNTSFSEMTRAFMEIISRVSDDESSIQDLVCKTFYEFWFEEPSGTQTQFARDGSCVPLEVARKTEQIVNLLRKIPNHQLLVTRVNAGLIAQVRKRCELMCKHLLERILQLEETSNIEVELITFPYVLALQAFCVVDPSLCAPATDPSQFVVTLQPYLKNQVDTRPVAQLLESIIFIVDAIMPLLRKPPPTVVEELEQDLKQMIVRHSFLTVSFSNICTGPAWITNRVFSDIEAFFISQLLGRSLFCLGLLVRYGKELMNNFENRHALVTKCLTLLKRFLVSEDFGLKALGFLLIARPEYMLEQDIKKILEASLLSGSDIRLKMQALQNINEYLLDAESQMGKDGANNPVIPPPDDAVNKVPVAAGAGDTNICGGIIQLYWDNILELCPGQVVLRQGLVHPITCVPYLVALETDPQEANSKLAHHLLMFMNEKYPAFFENRLGDGLQMSFKFVQSVLATTNGNVKGRTEASAFAWVRPGISRIYRLIRINRISRNKFMHSIVRKFEPADGVVRLFTFLYSGDSPFTCPDEPLYLIYDINRVLQLRAGPLESNMKMWSSVFHQKDLKDITNRNREVKPFTEGYYTASHNSATAEPLTSDDSCGVSEETLLKCQADCRDAIALQLLLKLKRHLKVVFSLDNARCQAFSLKEYPKPGETLSGRNIPFTISDALAKVPDSPRGMVDKYQEFKNSLRDDAVDYVSYSAGTKKRPGQRDDGEDDDGGGDEGWAGGAARNLGFAGQSPALGGSPGNVNESEPP
ncbi:unnamed protein product [Spirodela intermedia]|uniref:Sister chromatid cohesion protein n=1 Tax=Spirodela intermedia TaxID=51605 RepID=A0A7I8IJT6_SPIIN|nr:unnamed protein product [Spirodela intermedia]CAA6657408.1 unnamed protein product [Spirodela intermedia]